MCAKTNEKSGMTSKEVKQANKTLSTKDFAKKYSSYIGTSTNRISSASGDKTTSTSSNGGIMSTSEFAKKYSQYRPTNKPTDYTETTGATNSKQVVANSHHLKASASNTTPTNFLERFEQNYKTAQEVNNKGVDTGKRLGKGVRAGIQGEIGGVAGFTAKTALNNSGLSAEEMIDYNEGMPKDKFEQADELRKQQTIDNTKAINQNQWKKRLTIANEFINKSNATVEDAKENADAIQRFLVDVAKTGTEIAIDSAIGGVASIANPTLGQYASNASMYVRASGTAYVDALNKGATESEAQTYGTMVGAVEMLTERLSGGLGKVYGKGLGESLSTRVVTNVMKKLGSKPSTIKAVVRLGQVIGEGNEEVISDALNPILRSITYGGTLKEEYAEEKISDWLYDWLLGSFMGGLGSVVGANTNLNAEVDNYYNNNQNIARALSQMETQDAPSNSVVKAIMQDKSALEELGIDTQNKHASEIKHDIRVAIDELYFNSKDNVETETNTETGTNVDTNQVGENQVNNVDVNDNNIQQDVGLNDDLSNVSAEQANDITEVENANVGNVENVETDVAEQVEPRIKTDAETKVEKIATIAKTYGDEVAKLFNEEDADVDAITSVDGQKIMRNGYEGRKFYPLKNIGISIKEQYRIYQAGIEFRKGKVEERVQQSLRIENRLVREKQITYRQLRAIKSFEKITNHKIIFEDMQRSTLGYTDAFGNIHLNSNIPTTECYTQIIGHELYHLIFNNNKELGENFSATLQTMLDDNVSKKLKNRLVAMGYASTQVTEEMSADAFGVVFSEAEILESFAYTNMPLFKRISAKVLDFIKDFNTKVNKLSNVYKQDYVEYINKLDEMKTLINDIIEIDSAREVGIAENEDSTVEQKFKKVSVEKGNVEIPNDFIVNVDNMAKATKKYGHEKEINAFIGYLKALQKDKALAEKTVVNLKKRVGEETFNKIMQEYFNMPNETLAEVNKEVTNKKIKVQEEKIKKQAEEINKVNEQLQILSQVMGEENTAYAEMYIKYKELEKDIETKIKNNSQLVKENKSLKSAVKAKELEASSKKLGDAITKLRKTMSDNVLFNQNKEVTLDLMSEVLMNIQAQINGISSFKFDNTHLDIDKIETLINNLTAQGYVFQNEEISRLFKSIDKMNADNVAELTPKHIYEMAELVNSVAKQVSSRNKIIDGKGNLLDADLVADVIVGDYENIYVAKTSLKSMRFENLVSFITGYKKDNYLAKVLRDVQLSEWKQIKLVNDMNKFMGKFNQKKFKEHLQEEVEYEGVKMNRDLLISIYMHTFNEDNILHITNGGVYVPTTKDYYNPNKKNDAWNNKKALVIDGDIEKVQEDIEKILTKEDMEYAMMLKACISTMQKSVNRVSRLIQNADAWNINEYWAINVDKDIVGEGQEKLGSTISSVNTFGNRNHNSKKPILLHGTQDHISSLINIYSRYVGSGVEMHNLFTLLGLNIETEEFEETSIIKVIRNKFGNDAIDQLTRNIADFEGKKRNTDTNMFGTIRSLAYSKALVLNAGVASKQAVSFISACSEIGYRDVFNKHLVNHSFLEGNSINKLINKYTGLLDYRTKGMGDFENDISGIVKTPLMKINVNEKINESKYLNLITLVDYKTVQQLWYACENYVYRTTKLRPTSKAMSGTDAFYIRVAEVYNNVVTRTQPNYSTLERAEFIKSKDPIFMLTSMYKTQPAQNYNQAQYAINNYKAQLQYAKGEDGKVNKNDTNLKDAKNYCARTLATLTAQSIMYTLLDTAINALRTNTSSDDDDKDYFYFAKMAFTVANSIIGGNAYGNIILVLSKAMLGVIDYTDEVGVNLFDPIDNMATKINKLTKSLIKGENEVENWQAVSRMFTDVFGYLLPTGEAKRIYKALEKYVEPFKESEFNKKVAPWIVHS